MRKKLEEIFCLHSISNINEPKKSDIGLDVVIVTLHGGEAFTVNLRPVDLCCTHFAQQYIGSHIIENASDTILA